MFPAVALNSKKDKIINVAIKDMLFTEFDRSSFLPQVNL
jgi:hypothetical protein